MKGYQLDVSTVVFEDAKRSQDALAGQGGVPVISPYQRTDVPFTEIRHVPIRRRSIPDFQSWSSSFARS
jgi:hypothetical protein